jgi:hypothetical protein
MTSTSAKQAILSILCLATTFCPLAAPAQDTRPTVRATLERAYEKWRSAMLQRDSRAWAASVTTYRHIITRNLIVSQRKPFPDAIFAVPMAPPAIDGLRLLEAQAVGPTAHLLYFGKVEIGTEGDVPDNVLMLKFFNEDGLWKFDSSKLLQLSEQPDLRAQLQKGGTPAFLDYPEFTPPGKLPAVPPVCKPPQHVTGCTVQSYGYETRMNINGFDYPVLIDQAEKMLVIGGLNNGANTVKLSIKRTDIPKDAERLLQVDLFIAPSSPDKAGTRVFHFENKDGNLPATLDLPVIITDEVLTKGR